MIEITYPDDDSNASNNPQETFAYDAAGNRTDAIDALGNTTSYAFDVMNRLETVTGPDPDGGGSQSAAVTAYAYDLIGNLTSIEDPLGRMTTFVFDVANRLTEMARGTSYTVSYAYNGNGQLIQETGADPNGSNGESPLVTTYTKDGRGQVTAVADSMARLTTYDYNPAGELVGFS